MKVLIFYASYGGGHLSAAKAMKEIIQKKYPSYEIEVVDCMENLNKTINFITVKLYEEFAKKMPKMWGWVYRKSRKGAIAWFSNSVNRALTNKLGKLIKKINPDIIISAHPFSTQMCGILKKKGKLKIDVMTIMTDFKYHEQWLVRTSIFREIFCVE